MCPTLLSAGPNRMTPGAHVPPPIPPVSASVRAGPPVTRTILSCPVLPAMNATDWLSGDQNGRQRVLRVRHDDHFGRVQISQNQVTERAVHLGGEYEPSPIWRDRANVPLVQPETGRHDQVETGGRRGHTAGPRPHTSMVARERRAMPLRRPTAPSHRLRDAGTGAVASTREPCAWIHCSCIFTS